MTLLSKDSIVQSIIAGYEGEGKLELIDEDTSLIFDLEVEALGYKSVLLKKFSWKEKEIHVFYLESHPWELEEVKVQGYMTPLIDKMGDQKYNQIKPQEIVYTKEEKEVYQSIINGTWSNSNALLDTVSIPFSELYAYLQKVIPYSQKVIDLGIQEKIYLSFWVNSEGRVFKVKLRRGNTPALVLPVVELLSKISFQLKPQELKEVTSEEFLLPVKFVLD